MQSNQKLSTKILSKILQHKNREVKQWRYATRKQSHRKHNRIV